MNVGGVRASGERVTVEAQPGDPEVAKYEERLKSSQADLKAIVADLDQALDMAEEHARNITTLERDIENERAKRKSALAQATACENVMLGMVVKRRERAR